MFKIGDFSKLTLVSIRMLRHYDEIELFKPIKVDETTNYRFYSATQIEQLNTIMMLKALGMSLEEIKNFLDEDQKDVKLTFLKQKEKEIALKIDEDKSRLSKLSHYIKNYNEESNYMKYEVVIKDIQPGYFVSLRKTIGAYNQEGMVWGEFMNLINKHHVKVLQRSYTRFFGEPKDDGVDLEVMVEVANIDDQKEGLKFSYMNEIKQAATLLVAGDYEPNIQLGFNYMAKWLEENNYQMNGPVLTAYIKGPDTEINPDNYLTEIIIPMHKA